MAPKEIRGSMSKILLRFPQWISPRISLPTANLGEIPSKIAPRFWLPWIFFSARVLARFAVGFWRDFGHRDFGFPARILVRFAAAGEILATRNFTSQRESCQDPGGNQNPGSQNQDIGGIPAKIAAGSRQNPSPYFKRDCPFHTRLIRQGVMQPSLSELEV